MNRDTYNYVGYDECQEIRLGERGEEERRVGEIDEGAEGIVRNVLCNSVRSSGQLVWIDRYQLVPAKQLEIPDNIRLFLLCLQPTALHSGKEYLPMGRSRRRMR